MHYFPSPFSPIAAIFFTLLPILVVIVIWTIVIKGFALWHAARGGQKWWFIFLLVANTLGILEVVYLIWFRPKSSDTVTSASPKGEWQKES